MRSPTLSFDLDKFLRVRERVCAKSGHLFAGNKNSPLRVASIEFARRLVKNPTALGPAIPVDVFALAYGEPKYRSATKIGGLPFRPRTLPWPCSNDGRPRIFLCQWSFAESQDIVPALPGDVLLVFASTIAPREDDPGWLHFEWQSLSVGGALCRSSDLPEHSVLPFCCYGVRHRSVDYCELERACKAIGRAIHKETGERYEEPDVIEIARFPAWKIGGLPLPSAYGEPLSHYKETLIATVTSFHATLEQPYPYVNHSRSLGAPSLSPTSLYPGFQIHPARRYTELVWHNGARLYVTSDKRNGIHWELQYE